MTILVTGGAGFIGANFVLDWLARTDEPVITLDKLTYAGNPQSLQALDGDKRHELIVGDICDASLVGSLLKQHRPRAIINLAAERNTESLHQRAYRRLPKRWLTGDS